MALSSRSVCESKREALRARYMSNADGVASRSISETINGSATDSVYFGDPDDILLEVTTGH
jgi:hypothetical protein